MSMGTAPDCGRAAPQVTASSGLQEAAAGLGTEIVRFSRLIAAWKQRAKTDGGAADRVLLARLVVGGDKRATDLAADAFLDLSTVSRQVRSLVERGLVARRPDPEDRRGSLLTATAAGRAAFENYRRQRDAELAALLEPWSPQDRADLIRLLGRLNEDMAERQHTRLGPGGDQGAAVEQGDSRT
ncbi:MarR family winged helix-turn-helix transcriptional regulator [Streptomyces lydicus]|uniref:MarR family transcriptional regulator n=1 Tax=Streptomyces lydicus TaxID=47763 RepID=A0A1D7VP24_9ACTN|nr:MarR family winged helix-turn-helix transcriptional regulator [Streptomyces lydicus]AOP48238.1 MarR family transcriptional regulator [Streptomyces lydicus]